MRNPTKGSARDYQIASIKACFRYWREGDGNAPLIIAPTGSGKSVIIAEIIRAIRHKNKNASITIVTHSRELVQQNRQRLIDWDPSLIHDIGVVSGSLGNDVYKPVIFATIQTLAARLDALQSRRDALVIIDEAHRVPTASYTQYGQYLQFAKDQNQSVKYLGLTATPYRMDQGMLYEGQDALFDGVAYEIGLKTLIDRNYLVPPVSAWKGAGVDTKLLTKSAGDYSGSSHEIAFEEAGGLERICELSLEQAKDRKKLLWFLPTIETTYQCVQILEDVYYESALAITSHTGDRDRQEFINMYRRGDVRHMINVNVLTTGFDVPDIDCIVVLVATQSPNKFVQIWGRPMRIAPDKKDFLALDWGGNVMRLGFVDNPKIAKSNKVQAKKCPKCNVFNRPGSLKCRDCNHKFRLPVSITDPLTLEEFSSFDVSNSDYKNSYWNKLNLHTQGVVSWDDDVWKIPPHESLVTSIDIKKWQSRTGKLPSIRIDYHTYGSSCAEWLFPFHSKNTRPFKNYENRLRLFKIYDPFTSSDQDEVVEWLEQNLPAPSRIVTGKKIGDDWLKLLKVIP